MNFKVGILSILWICSSLIKPDSAVEERYVVFVFMGEDCVISQNYTKTLTQLYEQYAGSEIMFYGVFPNPYSSNEKMETFKEKYQLPFELILDKSQVIMHKYKVKITPEIVIWDKQKQQIRYQGRIDNTYFRVGKRRVVTTTSELADALYSLKIGTSIPMTKTQAVGCFITPIETDLKNLSLCDSLCRQ